MRHLPGWMARLRLLLKAPLGGRRRRLPCSTPRRQAASAGIARPTQRLAAAIPDVDTSRWTTDQWARLYLLLHIPAPNSAALVQALDQLFRCADVAEALALYQALPFLPYPEAHLLRAREGMRSNQLPLVAAVALDNPYAQSHFDEEALESAYPQMSLRELALNRVIGLEGRSNPACRICSSIMPRAACRRATHPR